MPRSPRHRSFARASLSAWIVGAGALIGWGCGDDDVTVFSCDDGTVDDDQVCFEAAAHTILLDVDPIALRVADFDGDGDDDALVTGLTTDGLAGALYRGDPSGVINAPLDAGIEGCSGHPIIGDLDGDAFADLLVATCDAEVLLFRGNPSGTFELPISQWIPALAKMVALVDADGDGADDLALLGDDGQLHVLPAIGSAAFGAPESTSIGADDPLAFAIADLDRDHLGDAVLLTAARLEIGLGQPGGAFAMQGPLAAAPTPPRGLILTDVDGDGAIDLLTRDADDTLIVLGGDGEGGFHARARVDLEVTSVGAILTYDLDGDGDQELLVADGDEGLIHAWVHADGRYHGPTKITLETPAVQLGVGDFNGDHVADLAAATFAGGSLSLLLATP